MIERASTQLKYVPSIGMECHVQLKTKTKLFAAVDNDARSALPNSLISHICVGLPGALPVLNEAAIELAVRAAFALNTTPQPFSKFDRKHYFYPDLPKGYQITQYDEPIIKGGHVEILVDNQKKKIGIIRVHLEEDAGKNIHPAGANYSLVDLNRAGTPLLEIVSQPDIHSAAEARAYARELYLLMKFADVTDGDLYHGHMRFDINVSVSKSGKLGTRTEIKNLNSFRSVEAAVEYEINRQIDVLESGQKVVQETRGWDEAKQKTIGQRGKEEAHDYRYFPDPDLPPIELDKRYIKKIAEKLPELPWEIRQKLSVLKIEAQVIEDILDQPPVVLESVLSVLEKGSAKAARRVVFWFTQNYETGMDLATPEQLIELSEMVSHKQLSSTNAKEVFKVVTKQGREPHAVAKELNLVQVSDEVKLEEFVRVAINENPEAADDIKKGELKAVGFLVGKVMAMSKGQANPGLAQKIIKKELGI